MSLLKKSLLSLLLLSSFFLIASTISINQETQIITEEITFWSEIEHEKLAELLVIRMTDEELLAQIFMFGWAGSEPSPLLLSWIRERALGSVKVFGWNTDNIESVARAVTQTQELSQKNRLKIPLFVATDQEGGWIRHIKGDTSDTPGNLAIGAGGLPIDAYLSGYYISRELRALGINMNFAPTIDLYTNKDSSVIGPRSFGEDAQHSAILGQAFCQGSIDAGIIPTAKHYPGHGDTSDDSHGYLPKINISKEVLLERELVPFKLLISNKVPAIMSGHLSFPEITKSNEPASLSPYFLNKLLREELGYTGLIITDDMMMNGATTYAGSLSRAFQLAIEAGNDIIISSTCPQLNEALWTHNLKRMKENATFNAIVKKAAKKVVYEKLVYFKSDNAVPLYPDIEKIKQNIPDPDGQAFFLDQACRSITLRKGDSIPTINSSQDKIVLASSYASFFNLGLKRYPQAKRYQFSQNMGPNETAYTIEKLGNLAKDADSILLTVANERDAEVARALAKLFSEKNKASVEAQKKLIVISLLSPTPALYLENANVIFAYSYSPYSFEAVFSTLEGQFSPKGILPFNDYMQP
ncbi:MAG TPA: glycoside hydrolase family 3 protein [Treponemataceae bacterium]|nr:glycoside hydrolase family 3 protein [Treponemataceae bacterium]